MNRSGDCGEGEVSGAWRNTHRLEELGCPGTSGQASGGGDSNPNITISSTEPCIKDVWNSNLQEEFSKVRIVVQTYNFVAMDTEYPGTIVQPDRRKHWSVNQYPMMTCNVNILNIIQIGLSFFNSSGETPPGISTWQFNFKFSLTEDSYAQESIDLLQNSGIQFEKHEVDGIDPQEFAALLMVSGVVLMDNIKWLTFHSSFDFGYLVKLLTDSSLPEDEGEFFELLGLYCPVVYDVKYLMMSCDGLKGGLNDLANHLQLQRVGSQHQAGSDALLTGMVFFKMREIYFGNNIDDKKYSGHLYGLRSFIN